MITEYLKKQTKRGVAEFALKHYDIELDKSLTKSKMIEELIAHEIVAQTEVPLECAVIDSETRCDLVDESDAKDAECVDVDSHEHLERVGVVLVDPVDAIKVEIDIEDEFKPKWMPTYRRGDELYQPLSAEIIHDWHIGRRDSHDLKTIEHWVKLRGELLVHERNSNSFTYLR